MTSHPPNSDPRSQLIQTLIQASSSQPDLIRQAVIVLKSWETTPGFYPALQEVAYDSSLEFGSRFQAVIYLKNGIDQYWRKTSFNGISPEDKLLIRSRLLLGLAEPLKQLGIQNSVIISKISRLDYPKEWPELIDELVGVIDRTKEGMEEANRMQHIRGLTTLHLVIKALSSKVLSSWKAQFEILAPQLAEYIVPIYLKNYQELGALFQSVPATSRTSSFETQALEKLEVLFMTLKILRRLMASGTKAFGSISVFSNFYQQSGAHLNEVYALVNSLGSNNGLQEPFSRFMLLIGKIYLELQKAQPIAFVNTDGWLTIMEFCWRLLNEQASNITLQKQCIQAMILFRDTVSNYSYMIEEGDSPDAQLLQVKANIDEKFLTREMVTDLLRLLVTRYLILRPQTDLFLWENDPEAWILEDEADHWEFRFRKCSERLVTSIVFRYKAWIGPMLLEILESVMGPKSTMDELLIKDAVYNALGLAAHDLFDIVDFDRWFQDHLAGELTETGLGYTIMRYRIAWLIGQWVSVKSQKSFRSTYYDALLYVMRLDSEQPQSLVIRWAAANSLKACIDDWDFEAATFLPYMPTTIDQLASLLTSLAELENKMKLMQVMTIIVERMESQIMPHAEKIASLLPPLWESAGDGEDLLKTSIVIMLTKLTKSLGPKSFHLYYLSTPIISHSVDPASNGRVYLLEDGLELWASTMQFAVEMRPELNQLAPYLCTLLTFGSENLKPIIKIISSYLLLAPDFFVQNYGRAMFENLVLILNELRTEAVSLIMQVVDYVIQLASPTLYQASLVDTGLFRTLVTSSFDQSESAYTHLYYLAVLSRLVIKDSSFFLAAFEAAFKEKAADVMQKFVSNWCLKIDNMSQLRDQKLTCLAWAHLLATPPSSSTAAIMGPVYANLGDFVAGWTGLLSDVNESIEGDALVYHRDDNSDDDSLNGDRPSQEVQRKKKAIERDPVHCMALQTTIHNKIREAQHHYDSYQSACGLPGRFQELLNTIDPMVLDQLVQPTSTNHPCA
ncbi:hypothetical protein DSO57_1028620 [Entomophthora muscae]|uniref:Uncharacterized protein n=1 Tax=Entomophthora muscae TaxID=34485 RepID=A0ACC2SQD3_9FUNG|nr:hypothetical protein DSO57_1028620 [Entomophthora muscae]